MVESFHPLKFFNAERFFSRRMVDRWFCLVNGLVGQGRVIRLRIIVVEIVIVVDGRRHVVVVEKK